VANLQLQIQEKNGKLELQLDAADDHLYADENHFSNMMNNLVDNAIKYSKPDSLWIRIATKSFGKNGIRIIVEDQGIGMKKENLSRIFEKFYRAHTGNVHNVKGFGLGLSYVKAMTETYLGKIQADSVVGKGSVFTLSFPREKQPTI
jgi:two-component system phosphate regulon sensor histidine kinase PhoR